MLIKYRFRRAKKDKGRERKGRQPYDFNAHMGGVSENWGFDAKQMEMILIEIQIDQKPETS